MDAWISEVAPKIKGKIALVGRHQLVRVTLEPQGWDVKVCSRGADAVELIASTLPSVVLVDLLMPETDGFAVVDALATRPETADIPIVVLTSMSLRTEDRQRLEGRIAFVVPPGVGWPLPKACFQ